MVILLVYQIYLISSSTALRCGCYCDTSKPVNSLIPLDLNKKTCMMLRLLTIPRIWISRMVLQKRMHMRKEFSVPHDHLPCDSHYLQFIDDEGGTVIRVELVLDDELLERVWQNASLRSIKVERLKIEQKLLEETEFLTACILRATRNALIIGDIEQLERMFATQSVRDLIEAE